MSRWRYYCERARVARSSDTQSGKKMHSQQPSAVGAISFDVQMVPDDALLVARLAGWASDDGLETV